MIDVCQHAVDYGERIGVDEIEAMWAKYSSTTIKAQLGEIDEASMVTNESIRIRVIKDKALSSVFTYLLDKESVKTAVEKALYAARVSKKDDAWHSLPAPGAYPRVDTYDTSLVSVSSEEMMDPVIEMLSLLPQGIAAYFAGTEVEIAERACVNSNGVQHQDKGALLAYGLALVGMLENGVTPSFQDILFSRTYDPDPALVAEPLVEKINLFKKADTASSGKAAIIFSPEAFEDLLHNTLFKAVSGDNVARGKSLLQGKEGELVASPLLTLHDNGVVPEGVYAKEMDDEGSPCEDTALLEEGVLQGFIWNDYWGKRMGYASTGNAKYDDRQDEMRIQQSTMTVQPGEFDTKELFAVNDGYYVLGLQGAHGANPESGDFSVVCAPAFKIRNGEITGGVTGMMLSDNIFSLLTNLDALGRELDVIDGAILPHARFSQVNVAAK
jgi:PmbA protein